MSCKTCGQQTSQRHRGKSGVPTLIGNSGQQQCPECGRYMPVEGGHICPPSGSKTDTINSDFAMVDVGTPVKMALSCGHTQATLVSPGDEEWCTNCDDWATVDGPAEPEIEPTVVDESESKFTPTIDTGPVIDCYLSEKPQPRWGPGKVQLWASLEEVARDLEINVDRGPYLGYAPSDGKGFGKVYGGFAGQGKDGKWYNVTSYGPIGGATVRSISTCAGPSTAFREYQTTHDRKIKKYSMFWPCDGTGKGLAICKRCGQVFSEGTHCSSCFPGLAKSDAGKAAISH